MTKFIYYLSLELLSVLRVVIIGQKDFNQDMDRYLEKIRTQSGSTGKFNFLKGFVDEDVPEMSGNEVHVEYKEPSFFRRIFSWKRRQKIDELEDELSEEEKAGLDELEGEIEALEDEESDLEEMEEELEERRESLMSRLMQKLSFFRKRHHEEFDDNLEDEVQEIAELEEDVKNVLKVTHTWIERLPPRTKSEFKNSADFARYKNILVKYGLVKETPKEPKPEKKKVENKPKKTTKK